MKKKIYLTLVSVFFWAQSYSQQLNWIQIHQDSTMSYSNAVQDQIQYFDSTGIDSINFTAYKEFQKWSTFWQYTIGSSAAPNDQREIYKPLKSLYNNSESICNGETYNKSWTHIGHEEKGLTTGKGRLESIYVSSDGNDILVGTRNSGLWKNTGYDTENDKIIWSNLFDEQRIPSFGVNSIAVNPLDPNTIYVSTGLGDNNVVSYGIGIIKSKDGGTEWYSTDLTYDEGTDPTRYFLTRGVFISPEDTATIYAFEKHKLHKSDNSGGHFDEVTIDAGFGQNRWLRDLVFLPDDADVIAISADDRNADDGGATIFISEDQGDNWTEINTLSDLGISETLVRIDLAVTADESDRIYAACTYTTESHAIANAKCAVYICYTEDNGDNWTNMGKYEIFNAMGWWYNDFVISPTNSLRMYMGGYNMSMSGDGGGSFATMGSAIHADHRQLVVINDNGTDIVFSANDGGIAVSYNNGADWNDISDIGLNIAEITEFDINTNSSEIIAGLFDNSITGRHNNTWRELSYGGDGLNVQGNIYGTSNKILGGINGSTHYFYDEFSTNKNNMSCPNLGTWLRSMDVDYLGNFYITHKRSNGTNGYKTVLLRIPRNFNDLGNCNPSYIEEVGSINPDTEKYIVGANLVNENIVYLGRTQTIGADPVLIRTDNAFATTPSWTSNLLTGLGTSYSGITDILADPHDENGIWICTGTGLRYDTKRIHYSSNKGSTWITIDEGLELYTGQHNPFSVYVMKLDIATGGMYIGTDVGVYYNSNPKDDESEWVCFNKDMPLCRVTDIKIDYCRRKILASTFGRGLWEADLAESPNYELTIEANETWDNSVPKVVYSDVIVKSGYTLTIKSEVRFAKDRTIYVEKGAQLRVEGGILTSMCNDALWGGIRVEGDKTKAQSPISNQGYVKLSKDGSEVPKIMNARDGISLIGRLSNGNLDFSSTGGLVHAEDAEFVNNKRDLEFYQYSYTPPGQGYPIRNYCHFANCTFKTTDEYSEAHSDIKPHVTMWDVERVAFSGCTFEDDRTSTTVTDLLDRRDGIYTIEASYILGNSSSIYTLPLQACSGTPSKFIDMRYAITSLNNDVSPYLVWLPISINCTEFTNCLGGIRFSGVDKAIIANNDFTIEGRGADFTEIEGFGIYLDDCRMYQVDNNELSSNYSFNTTENLAVGIVVRQNRSRENTIYRNKIDDFTYGSEAIGWNKDESDFEKGLKYKCNNFAETANNLKDILIVDDPVVSLNTKQKGLPQQGTSLNEAANLFGLYGGTSNYNIDNYLPVFDYYHNDPTGTPRVVPTIQFYVNLIQSDNPANYELQCPDKSTVGHTVNGADLTEISSKQYCKEVKQLQLGALVDGGSTEDLLDDISNANSGNIALVYTDLINNSPYLSSEVLSELAQSYSPFTKSMIRDIMILNPHCGRDSAIVYYLTQRTDTFPGAYLNQIDSAASNLSAFDSLNNLYYDCSEEFFKLVNKVLLQCLHDTIDHFDSIVKPILVASDELEHKYQLVSLYDARGLITSADSVLLEIADSFELTAHESEFLTDFNTIRDTLLTWHENNLNLAELDTPRLVFLSFYANRSNGIQNKVIPYLVLNQHTEYYPPVYDPNTSPPPQIFRNNNSSNSINNQNEVIAADREDEFMNSDNLKIYPNPTSDIVNFDFTLLDNVNHGLLNIYDISGSLVESIELKSNSGNIRYNTQKLNSGVYLCRITVSNRVIVTKQFQITR